MKFSVITPCYNAAPWIGAALRSAAGQTMVPHEIIVIDDGSTDSSVEKIRASGVEVRLLHSNSGNAANARNVGIRVASGDWIAFLDADDVWYANHLERAASLLSDSGDVAFMANHDWINLGGEVVPLPPGFRFPFATPTPNLPHREFPRILAEPLHFGHSTVIYRRERVVAVGAFDVDQKRRHDIDLWLRVVEGHTWAFDSVKSAGYREGTPGSLSKDEVECEYYYLRALLKNAAAYDSPAMRQLIATSARRAMSLSFMEGSRATYRRVRELAWQHIRPSYRWYYRCAASCPPLFRVGIRAKRWLGSPACSIPES